MCRLKWHAIFNALSLGGAYEHRLTHWGRVTHICVSDLTIIGSDNGLSPGQRQAIIKTNDGILLIRPLGTNFSEILIEILIFSLKKMRLKVSSAKRRPFCLGLNVLTKSSLVLVIACRLKWQAITWTNADSTEPSGTYLSKLWVRTGQFS